MSKNVYDLIVGICSAVDILANSISVYLLSQGKIDAKAAASIADVTVGVTGLVLGVCSRYIKEDVQKKKSK